MNRKTLLGLVFMVLGFGLVGCGGPTAEQKAKTSELVALIMTTERRPYGDWAAVSAKINEAKLPPETTWRLHILVGRAWDRPDLTSEGGKDYLRDLVGDALALAPDFQSHYPSL